MKSQQPITNANAHNEQDPEQLAADARHVVAASPDDEAKLDEALNLRMISIRLPEALIEDFKNIATIRHGGVGYQTLMRQALKRFATAELQTIAREMADQMQQNKTQATAKATGASNSQPLMRKAA
jgi:predicted DNA binding CopG/RHH family protein